MRRLPVLTQVTQYGYVYVARSGNRYKVGFSHTSAGVTRRVRDARGELVLCIPAGQRPSVLEYAINRCFSSKRLPPQGDKPGDKREWFALDQADIHWLSGLAVRLNHYRLYADLASAEPPKPQQIAY